MLQGIRDSGFKSFAGFGSRGVGFRAAPPAGMAEGCFMTG